MNFRNKVNFILNIGLPIIFMLLFGAVFGHQSGNINVFYYSDRNISFNNSSWKKLDEEPSLDNLNQLKTLNADIVVIAKNGKIEVYYLSSISQIGPEINLFIGKYMADVKEEKIFNIEVEPIVLKRQLNNLEYIMIGVIAISLLSVGMNAGVSVFSTYVRYGLFNRFTVTPVKPIKLLISLTSAQIFTGIISSVLILLLANLFYKVNLFLNVYYSLLFILVVISAVMISLAVGVVLSLLFKKSAQGISSFLYTIFIFFSGVYFPINYLPKSLRIISYFLPPRYVHMLFQKVYMIDSMSNMSFWLLNVCFILIGLFLGTYSTIKFLKPERN